jgi:hypothetical protein
MGWVGDLCDQKRGSHLSKGGTETNAKTSTNEHAKVLGAGLKDSTDQDDACAEDDTGLAAKSIGDVGSEGNSAQGTNRLYGVEKTEVLCRGVMEVLQDMSNQDEAQQEEYVETNILPAFDGLETIHHRTVESVGIGSDQRDDQEDVQLDDVAMLPPITLRVRSENRRLQLSKTRNIPV